MNRFRVHVVIAGAQCWETSAHFAAKDVLRTTIEHGTVPQQTRPNNPPPQQADWWRAIISFAALHTDDHLAMHGGL